MVYKAAEWQLAGYYSVNHSICEWNYEREIWACHKRNRWNELMYRDRPVGGWTLNNLDEHLIYCESNAMELVTCWKICAKEWYFDKITAIRGHKPPSTILLLYRYTVHGAHCQMRATDTFFFLLDITNSFSRKLNECRENFLSTFSHRRKSTPSVYCTIW